MDTKYIMMAVWFIVGLFVVPWALGFLLGLTGVGSIVIYVKLALEIAGAVLARKLPAMVAGEPLPECCGWG